MMQDSGFKAVLVDRENKKLLIRMLNCILPEDAHISDILSYRDREQQSDYAGGKKTFLDLVCEGDTGEIFNVEVQQKVDDFFFQRCVYYGCGLYHEELVSGDLYEVLRPVYVIAFLGENFKHEDETLWDRENIIARYRMIEERTGEFAPSTIFVIFAELKRFTKSLGECTSEQDKLFFWFKNGWKYKQLPEELTEDGFIRDLALACWVPGFKQEKYNEYISTMKNERDLLYRMKIDHDRGFAEGRAEGRAVGREEGKKEGERERNVAIAKNMLAQGLPVETVSQCTGLSIGEVNALTD
ncbi:MAG: Rpn family recombination-promoting nuclease/putative transposase [Candidatus Cryptobacteroides sp.]